MSEMPSIREFIDQYECTSTERLRAICPRLGECGLYELSLLVTEVDNPELEREGLTHYQEALPVFRCEHPDGGCGFDDEGAQGLAEDACDDVLAELADKFGLTTSRVQ